MFRIALAALALLMPATALAQAKGCRPPASLPRPRPDLPTRQEPKRLMPTTHYKLTLYWTPEQCRAGARAGEGWCDRPSRFALHGLWPDGDKGSWPQYCRATPLLSADVLRRNYCTTPSVQLMQHEWAKHGTCMTVDPDAYFRTARSLYDGLRYPDMARLARTPGLTTTTLSRAFALANRDLRANMVQVRTNRQGWLQEIWLCLDRNRHYAACPGRLGPARSVRILTEPRRR